MKLIECPRDAMQGISTFIPTKVKIDYLNELLKVGFDTLDCGSFVSPKAVPQMRDTVDVLEGLQLEETFTKILVIVGNVRGAHEASIFPQINYLGFPLSLSETFQKKNTNSTIKEAFETAKTIQNICVLNGMEMVCYLSMGFGNPYGDPYDEKIVAEFITQLKTYGIRIFSLSDTIGAATAAQVFRLYAALNDAFKDIELGVHLHSNVENAKQKVEAAYYAGCRRFDGALKGFGGCPMAEDHLVGNIATETIVEMLEEKGEESPVNGSKLANSLLLAQEIFTKFR